MWCRGLPCVTVYISPRLHTEITQTWQQTFIWAKRSNLIRVNSYTLNPTIRRFNETGEMDIKTWPGAVLIHTTSLISVHMTHWWTPVGSTDDDVAQRCSQWLFQAAITELRSEPRMLCNTPMYCHLLLGMTHYRHTYAHPCSTSCWLLMDWSHTKWLSGQREPLKLTSTPQSSCRPALPDLSSDVRGFSGVVSSSGSRPTQLLLQ